MMILLMLVIVILIVGIWFTMYPDFGKVDENISHKVPAHFHYFHQGKFYNILPTPMKPADISYFTMFSKMIEGNKKGTPDRELPCQIPNLLPSDSPKITWFGHSSYLLQVDKKNILVDPVFSARTSPFSFLGTKQFPGTDFFEPLSFPEIDVLFISHDHYDHLDYKTLLKIRNKVKNIICPIGVAKHFESWGFDKSIIKEMIWGESLNLFEKWQLTCTSSRHFSGRLFSRNVSLWASFILKTNSHKIYIGGDSGYGPHFQEIGAQYGPFDLAIIECGQYNQMWPHIHLFPEQVLEVAKELKAEHLLPVHWGKYRLALHDWDEPMRRLENSWKPGDPILMKPYLGQSFQLDTDFSKPHWIFDFHKKI
ncbi:MAG: MBL fold metallo-hydrolase [Pedobacter sp.]|nr:MAG: MBL fold metallo-hydrolase [Pedobacter sp.]